MESTPELALVIEGKTKKVFADDDGFCLVENKSAITANDDPSLTQEFKTKAVSATTTTCRVFELLRDADLPVAYDKQISETCFRAPLCKMIPLECVARRYAAGSYLKRRPDMAEGKRFNVLCVEFFLKTTGGCIKHFDGTSREEELTLDDPLIRNPKEDAWQLMHPKVPSWDPAAGMQNEHGSHWCQAADILPVDVTDVTIEELEELTAKAFFVLERAWSQLGFRLIDFKIEFGIDADGNLLVADVIDNDSWRLRTSEGMEVSKQLFRDGHPLAEVEEKYALVARLVERFRIPRQALVLWRADKPEILPAYPGVSVETIEQLMDRHPEIALDQFDALLSQYPDGGVVITEDHFVGGILAERSTWPVILYPSESSSIVMFSDGPPLQNCPSLSHAMEAAANILSMTNPAVYADRCQYLEVELS